MTLDEIAVNLGVEKAIAYGFVRYLQTQKLVEQTGTRRAPGVRGKGSKEYSFSPGAGAVLTACVAKLTV